MQDFFSLGIDFGSNAVRVLVADVSGGVVIGQASQTYQQGDEGVFYDPDDVNVARQSPAGYLSSLAACMQSLRNDDALKDFDWNRIGGIGIDATGSTPVPVTRQLTPVADLEGFENNLNAKAWMWKDHTSEAEAVQLTNLANEIRPSFLKFCGGKYSSEWFWAKIHHCANTDPEVSSATYTWVELSDFIPAILAGVDSADNINRNVCAAGHKALYNEMWGGYPDREFLEQLDPVLSRIRETLPDKALAIDGKAGNLCEEWARKLGLKPGIPIAMGALDAHVGAIGAGVNRGTLVKIIGTSACDIAVTDQDVVDIPGISGIVEGSVIPGFIGIEAGQSAVGDIFKWFVVELLNQPENYHGELIKKGSDLKPGETGLMALDWNNGNRNVLSDSNLRGMLLGQSLKTRDYEIYRALIEATAFGARRIIDQLEQHNVDIDRIVCCGGIPHKNPLFMQIYADVLGKPVYMTQSTETVALGAAIMGALVIQSDTEPDTLLKELQNKFCEMSDRMYEPDSESVPVYNQLYEIYLKLHDAFGTENSNPDLYPVMKELINIKNSIHKQ